MLIVEILEKNFTKLCHCLPQDYTRTIDKLKNAAPGISAAYLQYVRMLPSELINEVIVRKLISNVKEISDAVKFCIIIRHFIEDASSKNFIEALEDGM